MTHESPIEYVGRAIKALGQEAHNTEAALIWAGDNPRRVTPPEVKGERNRQIWVNDMIKDCLVAMAETLNGEYRSGAVDALANAALAQFVKEHAPEVWALHERFWRDRADIQKKLKELRQNEPELEAKEEA